MPQDPPYLSLPLLHSAVLTTREDIGTLIELRGISHKGFLVAVYHHLDQVKVHDHETYAQAMTQYVSLVIERLPS